MAGQKSYKYPSSPDVPIKEVTSSETGDSSPDTIDRTGFKCKTTVDEVIAALRRPSDPLTKDTAIAKDSEEWAKFNEVAQYGVTEEQEEKLLRLEVERLVAAADDDEPLIFEACDIFESSGATAYQDLSSIADQVLCNLSVCGLDNDIMLLENCERLFVPSTYRREHHTVTERLNSTEPQKHPRKLNEDNDIVYNALVDHLTSVIARLCIRCIGPVAFHTRCIAIFARLTMKLKFLNTDPIKYAEMALDGALSAMQKAQSMASLEKMAIIEPAAPSEDHWDDLQYARSPDTAKKTFEAGDDMIRKLYYLQLDCYERYLLTIVYFVLVSIHGSRKVFTSDPKPSLESFSLTTLVYGAGFTGHPTLVSQDRDGELGASSHPHCLRMCYNAFQILVKTAKALDDRDAHEESKGPRWTLESRLEDVDAEDKQSNQLSSNRTEDAVSVMIPLLCTSAYVASGIARLLYLAASTRDDDGVLEVSQEVRFEALATLRTEAYDQSRNATADPDISPLASGALAKQKLFYKEEKKKHKQNYKRSGTNLEAKIESHETERTEMRKLGQRIKAEWTIDQNAITIRCDTYVWAVLAFCFSLVAGGIAAGFSVGHHITGVDPFGITTFSWVFSAFLLLVLKSTRVENWPWRDFLLRRCTCRSVTELSSLTGIDPQRIIIYLLHNEDSTILEVKGPFNVPFRVKSTSGFAIDVKPTLRTLLLSGLVIAKVATLKGPALVCLSVRKGKEYVRLENNHFYRDDDSHLMSHDILLNETQESAVSGSRDFALKRETTEWHRVYGVYNDLERCFR